MLRRRRDLEFDLKIRLVSGDNHFRIGHTPGQALECDRHIALHSLKPLDFSRPFGNSAGLGVEAALQRCGEPSSFTSTGLIAFNRFTGV